MEVERRKHEYHSRNKWNGKQKNSRENKWNQNLALCKEQLTFRQIENLGEKNKRRKLPIPEITTVHYYRFDR